MYKYLLPSVLVLGLSACQTTTTTAPQQGVSTQQVASNTQLQSLIDAAWQISLDSSPSFAYSLGNKSAAGKLQDLSPATLEALDQRKQVLLQQLVKIDKNSLSKEDAINAQILQDQLQNDVDQYRYKDHYMPISAEGGFHAYIASIAKGRFAKVEDYQNYIKQLQALPNYFEQQIYWLKQGL
ncbi:DUF885 family protein, partial [Shewanella sp. 0m-11]